MCINHVFLQTGLFVCKLELGHFRNLMWLSFKILWCVLAAVLLIYMQIIC